MFGRILIFGAAAMLASAFAGNAIAQPGGVATPQVISPGKLPTTPFQSSGDPDKELAKFDNPEAFLVAPGPGGTEWDGHYRSLFQSDEDAVNKGYPTHAQAAAEIKEDATKNPENLQKHKGLLLYIKYYTQSANRPPEAMQAMKQLYGDLVAMEFPGKIKSTKRSTGVDASSSDQSQQAQPNDKAVKAYEGDPRLNIVRDVVYGKSHPEFQALDAYLLKSDKPTPVMVEIHGGGWRRGAKSQFDMYQRGLVESLLKAGVSVISIDYRLTPDPLNPTRESFPMPAMTEDTGRAIQFIRSKAKEWNIDPGRIAAMGGSAGAHLSAWIATHDDLANPQSADPVERESSRLSCFVAFAGPMDLTRPNLKEAPKAAMRGEDFVAAFTGAFGCTAEEFDNSPEIQKRKIEASPLFMVTKDDPPMFFIGASSVDLSGKDHPSVPAVINNPHSEWYGVLMADARDKVGVESVRYIGPFVGNTPEKPAKQTDAILQFLRKPLGMTEGASQHSPDASRERPATLHSEGTKTLP